jgi:serine/threonine protein kinase/tetratricopeptide (TPR) repeat protein
VQRLFALALEKPEQEREALLSRECAEAPQLKPLVEQLLRSDVQASQFMAGNPNAKTASTDSQPGSLGSIGRYKLLQIIGEGGFGTVYMAEQQEPIRRRVALKLIKLGMDTRAVIARFDAERQALAMMDHQNIARVLDAGETENGRPYFVMELVNGIPLTQYCDNNRLTARERIELFIPICQAVQHAHQKGIIHRDLKPSNVLVTLHDGEPTPKVIDFGIAKATQARLTERTLFTELRQMIGTPQYMSPEQSEMSGLDIDTRSDIYSLGVMLYELLTGTTPLDAREMRRQAYEEMQRWIREVDPPAPSARVSTLAKTGSAVATQRRTAFRELQSMLRGELDWVVMKCLEKNRSRRYETAAGLGADLSRYLLNEPVSAAKPSKLYQARKFVRRHRVQVAVVLVVGFSVVAGAVLSTYGFIREARQHRIADAQRIEADRQRSIAEARFADVRQLADDLMFKFDDALVNVAGATHARKMLADTALQYLDRLSQSSEADASLSKDLATSYTKVGDILGNPEAPNVGDTTQALASYEQAARIRQTLADADPANAQSQRDLCEICMKLGNVQGVRGEMNLAMASYGRALEIAQKLAGGDPGNKINQTELASTWEHLAGPQQSRGDSDEAMSSFRKAIAIRKQLASNDADDFRQTQSLSVAYGGLGVVQIGAGQTDQAMASFQTSLELAQKVVQTHQDDAGARRNLADSFEEVGFVQTKQGHFADALNSYEECLRINQDLAEHDPQNAPAQHQLSNSYVRVAEIQKMTHRTDEAIVNFGKALEIRQKQAAEDPGNTWRQGSVAQAYLALGRVEAETQKLDAALIAFKKALTIFQTLGEKAPNNVNSQLPWATVLEQIGDVQAEKGQLDDAWASDNSALAILQKLAVDHPDESFVKSGLTDLYTELCWCQLFRKDFNGALASARAGEKLDQNDLPFELKSAHALLFSNQIGRAKEIYLKHRGQQMPYSSDSWEQEVLSDFDDLEKHGVTTSGIHEIRALLSGSAPHGS